MVRISYNTLAAILCWIQFSPVLSYAQSERPNIIIILTDDQRWDALGYAGNKIIHTPNMDKLAREGIYFKNAFVTTPICAASRASIITGLYERTHQFTFDTPPLKEKFINQSYPKLLHDAGYRTGLFGKLGMELEHRADTAIFDELFDTKPNGYFRLQGKGFGNHIHLTDLTTDKAIEFIKNSEKGTPFCLSLSYNAPHADDASPFQYFWPERNDHLYEDVVIPKNKLHEEEYFKNLPPFLRDSLYMGVIRYRWRYDNPEKYQKMVKGYYKMISTIDDNIGRLRSTLQQLGIDQNTIIIFLGDNGYFLAERGLAGKWLMYENSLRVPLVIFDPKAKGGITLNEIALNIDVAATILDYAGISIPLEMHGKSLKSFTNGAVENWRTDFVCEHLYDIPYIPKSEGIRTERWKYFRYLEHPGVEELYDLSNDPLELINLAKSPLHKKSIERFRIMLDQRINKLEKNR